MDNKIVLVRSARELVEEGYIGYGWEKVKFNEYHTVKDLFSQGFHGINYGRKKKQIIRFFELKKDDIVVVPLSGTIAIGIVEGEKVYDSMSKIPFSANRVKVNFFTNTDGETVYIPRTELETAFERRLKIRMSISNLEDFRSEIEHIISALSQGEIYTWDLAAVKKGEEAKNKFIKNLGKRLRSEKGLGIAAGGYGLEKLIWEIFQAKEYDTSIPAKNSRQAGEDVDIIARKEGEFSSNGEVYLIQAKHHRGATNMHGLNQLIKYNIDDYDDEVKIYKVLMTTALKVVDGLEEKAKDEKIIVIKGDELAKWIYSNLSLLSKKTLNKLGISEVPTLI